MLSPVDDLYPTYCASHVLSYLKTGIGGLSSGQGISLRVDRSHEFHTLYKIQWCTTIVSQKNLSL